MNWPSPEVLGRLSSIARALRWNPGMSGFILTVALINAVLYHWPLYSFALGTLSISSAGGIQTLVTLFFLATLVTVLILALLSMISQHLLKPVCMVMAVSNAVALYFVTSYGVVLDKSMMGNVFNTNLAETSDLYHPRLLLYLLAFGAVPCWLLSRVHIQKSPMRRRIGFLVVALLIGVTWMYANSTTWLWIDKNAKRLGGMTMPWSYVFNGPRYLASVTKSREQNLLPPATFVTNEKTVVFLVIGEAARARNFSLYGYRRPTNPQLTETKIIALPHTRACSTYTTASVRCILSHMEDGAQSSYEPLPSYLQRHGVDVIWRTRNWGEPPLKVHIYERAKDLQRGCHGDACGYDELLLHGLEDRIRSSTSDKVFVVLHQHGSHGPNYYEQYPKKFEAFTPTCQSVDLSQCSSETLANAYDNTILYTDHFLHGAIELLKGFPETATALIYISDHGESLGEYGLYLHGTPYSIAPDVQKDIPLLVWMSDTFKRTTGLSEEQMDEHAAHSHANVFHSVMGAFAMRSAIYNQDLNIFTDNEPVPAGARE